MAKYAVFVGILFIATNLEAIEGQLTGRQVGKLREVFAWKQLTYDIDGNIVSRDRVGDFSNADSVRNKRQIGRIPEDANQLRSGWVRGYESQHSLWWSPFSAAWHQTDRTTERNLRTNRTTTAPSRSTDDSGSFFIQENNLPMGVERVGDRLFITVPRRRHGIPSTLNYVELRRNADTLSPPLRPYPSLMGSRSLTSVYRTRADECGRLWMVDTGLLEIPNAPRQVQPPAIVAYDLNTNKQVLRYPIKSEHLISNSTPTGFASITVDIPGGECSNAFAYVVDLATYGLIVYSLRANDSWRLTNNFFHFDPAVGNLNIDRLQFQWNDGIFSVALSEAHPDGCRAAYFHPMVSTKEYSVSTCLLRNRTMAGDSNQWSHYSLVGNRGENSHSTMHGYHQTTKVLFFAEIARSAVSCWHTGRQLAPNNIAVLAQDTQLMRYPSDLHVTGDEVWVMTNSLPRFAYSQLDPNEYNFHVYRGIAQDMISGTVCASSGQQLF